jgi:hypothetical protein
LVYDSIPKPPPLPDGWLVRHARPGDEEGILEVFRRSFDPWPRFAVSVPPLEHLRWKVSCHPLATQFNIVAESPDGIVGARLEWAMNVKCNDGTFLARESIDRAVLPEHRERYVVSAMRVFGQELRDKTFDMYMSYGSGERILRRLRKYRVPATRFSRHAEVLVCEEPHAERSAPATSTWEIAEVNSFDERADELWGVASEQFRFAVERSASYLNWRYADRRGGDYTTLAAVQGDRWLGYVVTRSHERTGYIADLFVLPDMDEVVDDLISSALDKLADASTVECWSATHRGYRQALDRAGFTKGRRSIRLGFRPIRMPADEASFLGDPSADLLFMAGDTDVV